MGLAGKASRVGQVTHHGQKYRRDVGTVGVVFLVVNGLIGSGIFALPELLHEALGTFAPWLMLAGAVLIAVVSSRPSSPTAPKLSRLAIPESCAAASVEARSAAIR